MILVKPERALSIQDLLDNAESRLGIKEFAGYLVPHKPRGRSAISFNNLMADLPSTLLLESICIIPSRCLNSEEVQTLISIFSSSINQTTCTCVVLAGKDSIPDALSSFLLNPEMFLFASFFDEFLLESRLIGLIREKINRRIIISGGLVNLDGAGVMITGESGLGKTSCSLELIRRGHRWVADDVVQIEKKNDGFLYGRNYDPETSLIEIKGWGIVRAEEVMASSSIMSKSRVDCFIEFIDKEEIENKGKDSFFKMKNIMGVLLPCISIPVLGNAFHMADEIETGIRILPQVRN